MDCRDQVEATGTSAVRNYHTAVSSAALAVGPGIDGTAPGAPSASPVDGERQDTVDDQQAREAPPQDDESHSLRSSRTRACAHSGFWLSITQTASTESTSAALGLSVAHAASSFSCSAHSAVRAASTRAVAACSAACASADACGSTRY